MSEVLTRPAAPPHPENPGVQREDIVLPAGTTKGEGRAKLTCDVLFQRDVAVELRDGTTIYIDIYRPAGATGIPALLGWGPFGKGPYSFAGLDNLPERFGVPLSATSGLEAWEGPDPAYWCGLGYAVVQPDPRGVANSGGDIQVWSTQEGRDEADVIDWIGGQDWCNGKVGLTGCSWLAASQWLTAAERPAQLAAIAPWQGLSDFYHDQMCRGGVPAPGFMEGLMFVLNGKNQVEDCTAMLESNPLYDTYWADKTANFAAIDVPAYIVTPYSDRLHTEGTFRGYRQISSKDKWLRIHNSMEWPDYYTPESLADLRRFFDYFLKGIENGWRDTPPVRLTILDNGHADILGIPEQSFPPADLENLELHLDAATATLGLDAPDVTSSIAYRPSNDGSATFSYTFDSDTDLIGYPLLTLWVEAEGQEDMDIFVLVQKYDLQGKPLFHRYIEPDVHAFRIPLYAGPDGRVRASRRAVEFAEDGGPLVQPCTREEPLKPGEIVQVQVPLSPIGMRWHQGEQLRIVICGRDTEPQLFAHTVPPRDHGNGSHIIHTGGQYRSTLSVTCRPANFTSS